MEVYSFMSICWEANRILEKLNPICIKYIIFKNEVIRILSNHEQTNFDFTREWVDKFYNITYNLTMVYDEVYIDFEVKNKPINVTFHNFIKKYESLLLLRENIYESVGEWFDREGQQCNHCVHADWEYGTRINYGWYDCKLGLNTRMHSKCNHFSHFNGKLIRKSWWL